jgi:UDP-N-acetylmuramyl tripeptide synthase
MVREHEQHTTFTVSYMGKPYQVESPLVGRFNVQNVLAAFGA